MPKNPLRREPSRYGGRGFLRPLSRGGGAVWGDGRPFSVAKGRLGDNAHLISDDFWEGSTDPIVKTAPTPSGGATSSGAATTTFVSNPGTTYPYSGVGGVVVAGQFATAKTKSIAASGSVSAGGFGVTAKEKVPAVAGGLSTGGEATTGKSSLWTVYGSGGVAIGGDAVTVGPPYIYAFTPSGGVVIGGSAITSRPTSGGYLPPASTWRRYAAVFKHKGRGGKTLSGLALASFDQTLGRLHAEDEEFLFL